MSLVLKEFNHISHKIDVYSAGLSNISRSLVRSVVRSLVGETRFKEGGGRDTLL